MNAYGEVMRRFQLLEMSYWSILAARKPPGMSLDQHIVKLTEWDRQTGERLKALDLPDDLHDEAMTAVNTRNLLAHGFLRERAVFFGDPLASEDAARVLVLQGQMYGRASLTCDDASPVFPATRHFSSM